MTEITEVVARVARNVIEAFFGTPRRVQVTAVLVALGVVYFNPGLLQRILGRFVAEMEPVIGPLLTLAIVFGGIYLILFGRRGGGSRRR